MQLLGQFSNILTSKIQIHVLRPKLKLFKNQMWFYSGQIIGVVHFSGERFFYKTMEWSIAFCALCSVNRFRFIFIRDIFICKGGQGGFLNFQDRLFRGSRCRNIAENLKGLLMSGFFQHTNSQKLLFEQLEAVLVSPGEGHVGRLS